MKAAQVPINRRMDKKEVVHAMEYYLAIKKNRTIPFVTTWMD